MAVKKHPTSNNILAEAVRIAGEEEIQCDDGQLIELAGVLVLEKIASAVQSLADSVKGLQ